MRRLAFLLLAAAPLVGADVAGSDLLAPVLTAGLAKVAPAGAKVDFAGTLAARRGLAAGEASLAIVFARPEEPAPTVPAGFAPMRSRTTASDTPKAAASRFSRALRRVGG